jgi:hypothetical protein
MVARRSFSARHGLLFLGIVVLGCTPKSTVPATVQVSTPFDESKGYVHKPSGVAFVYPEGWEHREPYLKQGMTVMSLWKVDPPIQVVLFWSDADPNVDPDDIGQKEYEELKPLYGDKLGKPTRIESKRQQGFKLAIDGGPVGVNDKKLKGVNYVFGVRGRPTYWKIKLRATVQDVADLKAVEALLDQYEWSPVIER